MGRGQTNKVMDLFHGPRKSALSCDPKTSPLAVQIKRLQQALADDKLVVVQQRLPSLAAQINDSAPFSQSFSELLTDYSWASAESSLSKDDQEELFSLAGWIEADLRRSLANGDKSVCDPYLNPLERGFGPQLLALDKLGEWGKEQLNLLTSAPGDEGDQRALEILHEQRDSLPTAEGLRLAHHQLLQRMLFRAFRPKPGPVKEESRVRRLAAAIGVIDDYTPHIVSPAGGRSRIHLRSEADHRKTLCGRQLADTTAPPSRAWIEAMPRGSWRQAYDAGGNYCRTCHSISTRYLSPSLRKAAEESSDYSVFSDQERQRAYEISGEILDKHLAADRVPRCKRVVESVRAVSHSYGNEILADMIINHRQENKAVLLLPELSHPQLDRLGYRPPAPLREDLIAAIAEYEVNQSRYCFAREIHGSICAQRRMDVRAEWQRVSSQFS